MPTFKIDGNQVSFEPGDTILRAAYRAGIDIPYYCWHPGLSVAANCRMCLVEVLPPPGRPAMMLDVLELDQEKGAYSTVQKPKLQPACQMPAAEGLEVLSDTSEHVRKARHAVQEFLLLNHPVDCPICDQAGECKLQDYWLEHMGTKKRTVDEPVHKPKGVSFGPTIVYDAERCILCTRCVRFCREVVKDPVLSVRERGNLNEIIVAPGRQLDHGYTFMTEHVCPVGALTTKDFRFKARVWFLRSAKTICQGCATGCNAWLDFDPRYQRAYRHRPRDNEAVNQHWMCDEGMLTYKWVHEHRTAEPMVQGKTSTWEDALLSTVNALRAAAPEKTAVLLSAQHSNEDNYALVSLARSMGVDAMFFTGRRAGTGDEILKHADKNPNTAGATLVAAHELGDFTALAKAIDAGTIKTVLALGSDVAVDGAAAVLKKLDGLIVLSVWAGPLADAATVVLPATSWAEASGTFVNAKNLAQKSAKAIAPQGSARPAWKSISSIAEALGKGDAAYASLAVLQAAMPKQAQVTELEASQNEAPQPAPEA